MARDGEVLSFVVGEFVGVGVLDRPKKVSTDFEWRDLNFGFAPSRCLSQKDGQAFPSRGRCLRSRRMRWLKWQICETFGEI